jgi:hypothetical protein
MKIPNRRNVSAARCQQHFFRSKPVKNTVVHECRRLQAKVIVAGAGDFPRNDGCKHGSYVKVHRDTYRGMSGTLLGKYTVRDRWMVDQARIAMFIWNGESLGTKQGYDYAVQCSKEAHLKTFNLQQTQR